ncbi:MAG: aldolase/citrate lyase family protein [Vicinamibacterales bacterium]
MATIATALTRANRATTRRWPGEPSGRHPVHVVYGGAQLFRANTPRRLGDLALAALNEYAPDARAFAAAVGLAASDLTLVSAIRERVITKLRQEPVEDYRLDFEDGYGDRASADEDGHAQSSAREVAGALTGGTLPPFIGIRIKPMSQERYARALRTLDLFVTTLVRESGGALPAPFVVTLPKILTTSHVTAVVRACDALERSLRLRAGAIGLELMIETPQAILGADGTVAVPALVAAGAGRVASVHFGPYDYTALCGITAAWQRLQHPACDLARHLIQTALAQSGVRLSDGPTNLMPVPRHKAAPGTLLSAAQRRENRASVHDAWRQHFDDVGHALRAGIFQGWDLHPAQLVTRYAALYAFFLSAREAATTRLRRFIEQAARATLSGNVFDDAASGQGLVNFFVRGLECGALTPSMAEETGLTADELRTRSFLAILDRRAAAAPAGK